MKKRIFKILLCALCVGFIFVSCSNDVETPESEVLSSVKAKASIQSQISNNATRPDHFNLADEGLVARDFNLRSFAANAVVPSECGPTPFREVYFKYDDLIFNDFLNNWDGASLDPYFMIFGDYPIINYIAANIEDYNTGYFGVNGEYTNYVKNRVRSLESFWDMSDLIDVRGQHSNTLEDLGFIRYVYENYSDLSAEEIDTYIGYASYYNNASDQIPENPTMALDGFATFDRKIVIGDGIVTILAETGLDPKVVWSGILAHEWGHQMQFLNFDSWAYPLLAFDNTPESTRMTELEADFLTGYYLTHKRGATYNWKRVEDVLSSFFNIGDCGFTSSGHHGTPLQRMEAARLGYELANSAQKKGKILSGTEVHYAFIAALDQIVGGSSGPIIP